MKTFYKNVEKEHIKTLTFPNRDVFADPNAIHQRISELSNAFSLGNLQYFRMKIFFEDNESKKVVESCVREISSQKVILDNDVVIPVNRIYKTFKFFT